MSLSVHPIDRILVVGFGSIGARHVRIARELFPNAIIAVMRRDCSDIRPGSEFEICIEGIDEAIRFGAVAAVLAGPATTHIPLAMRLVDAGVHLLIEKPISARQDGVSNLLSLANSKGLTVMTGYNLRYKPSLRAFKDAIRAGEVGTVLSVRVETGQYLPSWRPGIDYRSTVSARSDLGGGVLLELSHEIDYVRWIFGPVVWVSAVCARQSALEIDVDDLVNITMGIQIPDEAATIVANLTLDFFRHDTTRLCVAIGSKRSIRWNGVKGTVDLFDPTHGEWREICRDKNDRDQSYRAEWRDFARAIGFDTEPEVSGWDGLETLRIVDAARRSSKEKRIVTLNEVDLVSSGNWGAA